MGCALYEQPRELAVPQDLKLRSAVLGPKSRWRGLLGRCLPRSACPALESRVRGCPPGSDDEHLPSALCRRQPAAIEVQSYPVDTAAGGRNVLVSEPGSSDLDAADIRPGDGDAASTHFDGLAHA